LDIDCSGSDAYLAWLGATQNEEEQDGDCDSSREDFDADTDECGSTDTCGTATWDGISSYSVLGCYPSADCDAGATALGDSTITATLVCGATKMFATAASAIALASFM